MVWVVNFKLAVLVKEKLVFYCGVLKEFLVGVVLREDPDL